MVGVQQWAEIRRPHFVGRLSQCEIRRRTGLAPRHGRIIAMTRVDAAVKFTAETWEPILSARVQGAVEVVLPHGEAWRLFRPETGG